MLETQWMKRWFWFLLGHEKVAELLIKNGSDVNVRGRLQNTPIMFAATNGLKKNMNSSRFQWSNEMTELYQLLSGNEKVADLLIRSGSDINVRNELNYTLLHLVAFKGLEIEIFSTKWTNE